MTDDYADIPEDERPNGPEKAKAKAKAMLTNPKYDRPHGHKDDDRTREDDMADPAHNKEEPA